MLIALPYKAFDLDRYFVPKEVVLTAVTGVLALLILALGRARRIALSRVDTFLIAYGILSVISAALATNKWLAGRAMGVTLSGIALFWIARHLAQQGFARRVVKGIALATVVVAVTSLLQTYGLRTDLFSLNRAPGGTLGNRNFIAHAAAIGAPAIILSLLWAKRWRAVAGWSVAIAMVAGALALSRSRAAWLAVGLGVVIWIIAAIQRYRHAKRAETRGTPVAPSPYGARLAYALAATVLGATAAVTLPNTLNWRSHSPYLDSVVGVVDYHAGSGHGRVVQYVNTLRMAAFHPVLGVGPGNWSVVYPHVVTATDPSISREDGMAENPWPSSDWAAVLAERGLMAWGCLILAMVGLVVEATRVPAVITNGSTTALPALALIVTVVIVTVTGAFDAVLLLPAPTFLAWALMGALDGMLDPPPIVRTEKPFPLPMRVLAMVLIAIMTGCATVRGVARMRAMALVSNDDTGHTLLRAATMDPGSYRLQIRAAEAVAHRSNCTEVKVYAGRANALFPYAPAPRRLLTACGVRPR